MISGATMPVRQPPSQSIGPLPGRNSDSCVSPAPAGCICAVRAIIITFFWDRRIRPCAVPSDKGEGDSVTLERFERREHPTAGGMDILGKVLEPDAAAPLARQRRMQHPLELGDVARPGLAQKRLHHLR